MMSIASVMLKYVWLSIYVLEGINTKLTFLVITPSPTPSYTFTFDVKKLISYESLHLAFKLLLKLTWNLM
jgi:hypothetical protein